MSRYNARKNQGRIKINFEASEKLSALFPELSDTSLLSSDAEHSETEKRDTGDRKTSTPITETNRTNTCGGVNSLLPKIVITPPAANDNGTKNKDVKTRSPPKIKLPLLPTSRLRPPGRIQSAAPRRAPPSFNARNRPSPIGKEKSKTNDSNTEKSDRVSNYSQVVT